MEVEETSVVEIFVDGKGHGMAQTEHTTEVIGARTQVRDFTQELHRVALLLQRIRLGVGGAIDLDGVGLDLNVLSLALGFHQGACHMDTGTGGDLFHERLIELSGVSHHLQVGDDRAVVEGNELHEVVAAA